MEYSKGVQYVNPAMHRIRFTKEEVKQALVAYACAIGQVLPEGSILVSGSGGGYYNELTITEHLEEIESAGPGLGAPMTKA